MRVPDSVANAMLDAVASGGPDRQVGLSVTPITVTSSGLSGITEPAGASYARVALPASAWSAASGRTVQASVVQFSAPAEDWGTPVAYFLTDAAGVPEIPVKLIALNVAAGSSAVKVTPRISSPMNVGDI